MKKKLLIGVAVLLVIGLAVILIKNNKGSNVDSLIAQLMQPPVLDRPTVDVAHVEVSEDKKRSIGGTISGTIEQFSPAPSNEQLLTKMLMI